MKHYELNYCKNFKCKAGKCEHTCCAKWEIDVDARAIKRLALLGENDERVKRGFDEKTKTLKTDENRRCLFLDDDGLCYIIKKYGERVLPFVCKTHPRFKNFFTGRVETGLGLACEEAARKILSLNGKMRLVLLRDTREEAHLSRIERSIILFRNKAVSIANDKTRSVSDRVKTLLTLASAREELVLPKNIANALLQTDFLEPSIKELYAKTLSLTPDLNPFCGFENAAASLLSYFIFRHISRASDQTDLKVRLAFAVYSLFAVFYLAKTLGGDNIAALTEAARTYSAEVEYSDDNTHFLLDYAEGFIKLI